MKIYIKSAVSIDNLKSQFGQDIDDDLFDKLLLIDPTTNPNSSQGGKYCPWILKQYNKGNLETSEFSNLKDALSYFTKNSKKYTYSDIGRYATVDEFLDAFEEVSARPLTDKEQAKMLKKSAHKAGDKDKKLLAKDGEWELWRPLTQAGSISLARWGGVKADWCTAYEDKDTHWKDYIDEGPLYIFINTSDPGEKYQVSLARNEFNDIDNIELRMDGFYRFIGKHPNFNKFFKTGIDDNGMIIKKDTLKHYCGDSPTVEIPDGILTIGGSAFIRCDTIEKVVIPESVKQIGSIAFRYCSNLSEVVIKNPRCHIGQLAFANCENLKEVTLPKSLYNTIDKNNEFYGCPKKMKFTRV